MDRNRENPKIVRTQTIGGKILNILPYHIIRNICSTHRGTNHTKRRQIYHKSQEYAQTQIAKTGLEHMMQGTKKQ